MEDEYEIDRSPEDWCRLCVESAGEPHVTFGQVVAVVKNGICCPHDVFTHIKTVEIPVDVDPESDIHRTTDGFRKMFPEAFGD